MKNVREMIVSYLEENNMDGLTNPVDGCACFKDEIGKCDKVKDKCCFGYKTICDAWGSTGITPNKNEVKR